jgi:DNA-binding transcriptional regulator YiaG
MLHYTECGLDNIWLQDGFERVETPYGTATTIDNIKGLHDAISKSLFTKKSNLTGKEFLFLRKELDLSQVEIARLFGVSEGTARNLERKEKLDSVYSHLMKAICQEYYAGQTRIFEIIESTKDDSQTDNEIELKFCEDRKGWHQDCVA